jgi:hypothetical protein
MARLILANACRVKRRRGGKVDTRFTPTAAIRTAKPAAAYADGIGSGEEEQAGSTPRRDQILTE